MGILIGNGSRLYRKSSSLVRTPIKITLSPDEMAYYSVADIYKNQWPYGGFLASASMSSISSAGSAVRSAFVNHTSTFDKPMIWRKVTSTHQPENIFYQGCWAPSVGSGNERGEAYMQLGGYHFVIPPGLSSLSVTGARLVIKHGGEICCYQSAQSQKDQNFFSINYRSKGSGFTDAFSGKGWDTTSWNQKVGIWENLNDNAYAMYQSAQTEIELSTGEAIGSPKSYARIWIGDSGSSVDGCIPVSTEPYDRTYQLPQSFTDFLNQKQHGWIVTIPEVNTSTSTPGFTPTASMAFYWICESHWGYRLELDMC